MGNSELDGAAAANVFRIEPAPGPLLRAPVVLAREQAFSLGAMLVEPALRQVSVPGSPSETIEPRVMEVLVALHRARGAILTRDDLTVACWRGMVVGEDAIQRVIQRLRKVGELGNHAFRIETITKVGYRLVADGASNTGAPVMAVVGQAPRRRWSLAIAGAALVAALLGGWLALKSMPALPPLTVSLAKLTAVSPTDQGLTGRINEALPLELAAERVAVQTGATTLMLSGTVGRNGDAAEIAMRLNETATGTAVWSRTIKIEEAGAAGEGNAIKSLSGILRCGIGGARNGPAATDAEVVGMLLRHCEGMVRLQTPEATLDNARRLVAKAPRLWSAQLALADAAFIRLGDPAADAAAIRREGLSAADAAIALIPDAAEGYASKAMITAPDQPYEREVLFRKAIDSRFVNCPCALQWFGDFLLQSGRTQDALAMYQRGEDGDGASEWRIFIAATMVGKDNVADAALAKLDALGNPGRSASRSRIFRALWRGDYRSALVSLRDFPNSPIFALRTATYEAAISGDPRKKAAVLKAIDRLPMDSQTLPITLPLVVALGDTDRAFTMLERSLASRRIYYAPGYAPSLTHALLWDPSLRPLWRDPRFAEFLKRAGYYAYWKRSNSGADVCANLDKPDFCKLA